MRIVILTLVIATVCWFGGKAGYGIWKYYRLSALAPAAIKEWEIEEWGSKTNLAAVYSYVVGEKRYSGKTIFKEPQFLNRYSAEKELESWKGHDYQVWYSPSNPAHSSLQKLFPYKMSAYGLVAFCVLGYLMTHLFKRETE